MGHAVTQIFLALSILLIMIIQVAQSIQLVNTSRASYLIKECSIEQAQTGETYIRFDVYLQENGTITLDIAENITEFRLYVPGISSIDFINTHSHLEYLYIYGTGFLYCPYDFLKYFPNLRTLILYYIRFDRFPLFNSTSLADMYRYYLTLPNLVTIQRRIHSTRNICVTACPIYSWYGTEQHQKR